MPMWARFRWLGEPRVDEHGLPTNEPWEVAADGFVHALSVLWSAASAGALLAVSTEWRYCVFSVCTLLTMCSSAAFNMLGVSLRIVPELLRCIDHAAIFLYIGGVCTALGAAGWELVSVWVLCGTGVLTKLASGRAFETFGFGVYLLLGLAPLFSPLWHPLPHTYPYVASGIALLLFGGVFGYMANYKGATAVWHACVLATTAVFWAAALRLARGGSA